MINLKSEFGSIYRVSLDESADIAGQTTEDRVWLWQIKCKRGHVYVHGVNTLGAYCDRSPSIKRLLALPFVKLHQRGDRECTVTFDPSHLEEVLQVLSPYKRRQVSEEERQRLASIGARTRLRPRHSGAI